jgi:hypothetical protein
MPSRLVLASLWLATLAGCSDGLVDLRAKVLVDGQPLSGASVTLVGAGGRDAYGTTNEAGIVEAFTTTERGDGVPPGEYRVLINKSADTAPAEIPRLDVNDAEALKRFQAATRGGNTAFTRTALPAIYLDPATTPLTCTVESGVEEVVFEVNGDAGA